MFGEFRIAVVTVLFLASTLSMAAAAQPEPAIVSGPGPDKATIVFMRPSGLGIADHAPIFDVSGKAPVILARLGAHKKIAEAVNPGPHRFMVIGNRATLLDADVAAGKVYYVLVTPEQGGARPHFVFMPVTSAVTPVGFAGYQAQTEWVGDDMGASAWADHHIRSIEVDEERALREWHGAPRLNPGDAR